MKRKNPKKTPQPRWGLICAAVAGLLLCAFVGSMVVKARVLHVMRACVELPDLPPAFDGTKILYITDVDICGMNTVDSAADAVDRLRALKPDMLILGGDLTSPTLSNFLDGNTHPEKLAADRDAFLARLADFDPPLGKYALASRDDVALGGIENALYNAGFAQLNNSRLPLCAGDQTLWLVGIDKDTTHMAECGASFNRKNFVLCVAESPECFPRILTAEAKDSGPWADLCLAGGTHGGQVVFFGRPALNLTSAECDYCYGWTREPGIPMLTSSGMGCEGVNLRFGSQGEVWVIEVRGN